MATKIKAWKVRDMVSPVDGGRHALYRTNGEHRHVIASAVCVLGEPETYIFEADERGEVTDWCELEGSRRGTLDIESVMAEAYDVEAV